MASMKTAKLLIIKMIIIMIACLQSRVSAADSGTYEDDAMSTPPKALSKAFISVYPDGDEILIEGKGVLTTLRKSNLDIDLSGSDREVTEKDLKSLTLLAGNIYRLNIAKAQLKNSALDGIPQLTELRELDLSENYFDNEAFPYVAKLQKLESLKMAYNLKIDAGGLANLGELKLRKLELSSCTSICDSGAQVIGKFGTVEHLDLEGCGLGDTALPPLLQMKALRHVNVSSNKFSQEALTDFMSAAKAKGLEVVAQYIEHI